jgi:preprotein translocase subunit YajC
MPRMVAKAGTLAVAGKAALLSAVLFGFTACQQPGQQGGAEGGGGLGGIEAILPLILIFVVFYFLLIRPQQKKQKAHREMLNQVSRGDDVVTNGGIVGHVIKVGRDENLLVEIAPGVRVRVMRNMISEVIRRPDTDFDEDEEDEEYEDEEGHEEEYEEEGEFEDEEPKDDSSGDNAKK